MCSASHTLCLYLLRPCCSTVLSEWRGIVSAQCGTTVSAQLPSGDDKVDLILSLIFCNMSDFYYSLLRVCVLCFSYKTVNDGQNMSQCVCVWLLHKLQPSAERTLRHNVRDQRTTQWQEEAAAERRLLKHRVCHRLKTRAFPWFVFFPSFKTNWPVWRHGLWFDDDKLTVNILNIWSAVRADEETTSVTAEHKIKRNNNKSG